MTELRKFKRAPSSLKVEMVYQGRCHPGCLGNISLSGALVHLDGDAAIGPGQLCLLRMPIPGVEKLPPLEIWCEAVHCGTLLAGIKFVDCGEETVRHLALLMEYMKGKPPELEDDLARIRAYLADYHG